MGRIYARDEVKGAALHGDGTWDAQCFAELSTPAIAMRLLAQLDGLTVEQVTAVLREAQALLGATTVLDCSASDFVLAAAAHRNASDE